MASQKKTPRGRKIKLSPQKIKIFARYIAAGGWFSAACHATGISEATGYIWLNRGRENRGADEEGKEPPHDPIYTKFLEAYEQADAEAGLAAAATVVTAAKKDWRAAAFFLERRHPQIWRGVGAEDDSNAAQSVNQLIVAITQRVAARQLETLGASPIDAEFKELDPSSDDSV